MPERTPTARPQIMAGTIFESGCPNTGQIPYTQGGCKTHTVHSGTAGGDANIHVGAGRLDRAVLFAGAATQAASGKAITFYDSAVAVSGGPLAASGHKVLGTLQAANTNSGMLIYGEVRDFGITFTSGLCHTGTSGNTGFTVSYTPVVSG